MVVEGTFHPLDLALISVLLQLLRFCVIFFKFLNFEETKLLVNFSLRVPYLRHLTFCFLLFFFFF